MRNATLTLALACLAACTTACTDDTGDESSDEFGVDEDDIASDAADYASYERVTATSLPSQHGLAATVHVWVPADVEADYRALDPADPDASASFEPGTLLIKEHLDAEGMPAGLTVMFKGEPGYDPDSGDWWWGNLAVDGTINDSGAISYCIDCHEPRSGADWVFGVAAADQS